MNGANQPLIEMRAVAKEYRGVPAIRDIDFVLDHGEVHALVGENGAGKSTLTKIMAGVITPTSGTMLLDGRQVLFERPAEALKSGVAMVFQENSLVPSMTVAQNLYLGREKLFNRLRGLYIAAQQFLQSLNFNVNPTAQVATLGVAQRQMVEIARSVLQNARVIIFDEPTASLTPEEKGHFFSLMARLKARQISMIYISHAIEESLSVADRITILRDGELIVTDDAKAFDRDAIISGMVGRTLRTELYGERERRARPAGPKALSVQNVSMGNVVRNNSFSVYEGQITGIFGLIGSGRTETAKIVAGICKRDFFDGGEVRFYGRSVRYRVPRPAVKDGIVYVTEDRKLEGFFENMSMSENLNVAFMTAGFGNRTMANMSEKARLADHWRRALSIRAITGDARVIELSGGNQQKIVIAKSLVQKPRLIFFDEPTRGVDVGAISEIHQLINRLAEEGYAVVMISSYLPEVMNLSDRILVAREGRVVEEFSPMEATQEKIMYAAVH